MFVYTLALFAVVLYLGLRYIYSYWARQGFPHLRPEIPYGNLRALAEKRESFGVAVNELYARSTERLLGVYLFFRPAILVRDAHLAKRILVADFQHFHDRGLRQGIMLSKIGLVLMLSRFDFEATVPRKVRFEPANVTLTPDGGLPMKITVRGDRAKVQ